MPQQDPLSILRKYQQAPPPAGQLVPAAPPPSRIGPLPGEPVDPVSILKKYQPAQELPPQLQADLEAASLATPPRGGFQPIEPYPVERILQSKGEAAYAAAPEASRLYETMVAAAGAMGIPEANVLDILRTRMKDGLLPALGKAGEDIVRGPLSLLPGVSRRDPGPEAQAAAQARQAAGLEKLKQEPLSRGIPQAIGGLAGMIGPLGAIKAPMVAGAARAASGIASPTARALVGHAIPSAAAFGTYSAGMESENPNATPESILKAAGKGIAIDATLQGAGKIARSVMGPGFFREAASQGAALTGANELFGDSRDESPSDRLKRLGYEGIINTATMGAARLLGPMAPGQIRRPAAEKPKTLAEMEADPNLAEAPLPTIERYGTGTAVGPKELQDPQRIARAMDVDRALLAGQSPTAPQTALDPQGVTDPRLILSEQAVAKPPKGDPSYRDPSFTSMLKGQRAVYLDPKGTALTANERAFRANPPKDLPGVNQVETSVGTLYFKPEALEALVASTPEIAPLAVRDPLTGQLNSQATVDAVAKRDLLGALLQYGKGNESKKGGQFTVTGRDARGVEIATIIAKDPVTAEQALREHHGAVRVETKPVAKGSRDIILERGRAGPITSGPVKPELPPQAGKPAKVAGPPTGRTPPTPKPLPGLDPPASREGGFLNLSPRPDSPAGRFIQWAKETMDEPSELGTQWFRIQFSNVKEDPKLHSAAVRAAVTNEAAGNIAATYVDKINTALPEAWKRELFGRMLVSEQHDALLRQGRSPNAWMRLTPKQNALIQQHRAEFDQAETAWNELLDYMKNDQQFAGIQSLRPARIYAKLVPIRSEKHADELLKFGEDEGRQTVLTDPQGVTIPGQQPGVSSVGVSKYRFATRHRNRKAQAASMASGSSEAYSIDPLDMARDMVRDRLHAANHMRLKQEVLRHEVKPEADTGLIPRMVDFGGKQVPTQRIDIERQPNYIEAPDAKKADVDALSTPSERTNSIYVPEPVAQAWRRYLNPPEWGKIPGLNKLSGFNTRLALISGGGDLTYHALSNLGILSTVPGLAKTPLERAMLATGLTRSILAFKKALSVHDANFQRDLLEMYRVGGLRGGQDMPKGAEDKIPVLGYLKHKMFGPTGGENRMRIAAFRAIRDLSPEMSSEQIAAHVNDLFGTYSKALSPEIIRYSIGLDAFARPALGAIKTGVKTIAPFWKDPITGKRRYGTAASFTLGTYALIAAVQAAVDPERRFPWQIKGLRPWNIRIGGRDYPIATWLSSPTHRGLRHSGMDRFVESLEEGEPVSKAVGNAVFGAFNSLFGRLGPIWRTTLAGATGSAPYMIQNPSGGVGLLQITDPNTRNPGLERVKAAAGGLIPGPRDMFALGDRFEMQQTPLPQQAVESVLKYFALLPPLARNERIAEGRAVRRDRAELQAVARDVVLSTDDMTGSASDLAKFHVEQRTALLKRRVDTIQKLLRERVPDEDYSVALQEALQFLKGHMRSIERSAEMAGQK